MTTRPATAMQPTGSVSELLVQRARTHSLRTALTDGTRTLDYQSLDAVAGQVATTLRTRGMSRGQRVVLLGPRDARMLALLYGVFRSGAAAVVVGEAWGEHDLARRLDAIAAGCVVTTDAEMEVPGAYPREVFDVDALMATRPPAPLADRVTAADLAYLAFTSGSAGEPKAVAVRHASAVHYALSLRQRLGFTEEDAPCIAHVTTLGADLGHTAWLLALATAGRVHVVPDHLARDPEGFWSSSQEHGVSCLKTTPSHLMALLEGRPATAPALHTLVLGGEALPRLFAAGLLEKGVARRVVNHYGPTETTVGASCFVATDVRDLPADEVTVPIGTPIGDAVLRLLDRHGREEGGGKPGELLVGGKGVAAGYFNRPDETARRFELHDGERIYRTGDICRRRPDGNLVFLGRSDRQVKIRGYRVDPPEIERVIDLWPGVVQSAVMVRDTPGGPQLLAAVRLAGGRADAGAIGSLRAHLRDQLPDHCVPALVVALPAFPVGSNGKLDRERLASVVNEAVENRARRVSAAPAEGPGSKAAVLERDIAALWADALGLPGVGVDADVFGLGGDSILAMRTVALLRRRGSGATFEDVYRNPTPALLAAAAAPSRRPAGPAARLPADPGKRSLAPAQRWFFRQAIRDPGHWNQAVVLRCREAVDAAALAGAVRAVLHRHTALRQPLGPDGPLGEPRPAADLDVLTFSTIPRSAEQIAALVCAVGAELQRSLDLEAGRLLRVHLFVGDHETDDRLAIIVHHLVVDGLSWRILLDDLAGAYRAVLTGRQADLPATPDYYQWAAALSRVKAGAFGWPRLSPLPSGPAGTEEPAPAALTWALDGAATARLVERWNYAQRLEALLLAAFAGGVAAWSRQPGLAVEVETHGRDATAAGGDYLDTVGWFTAVKWVVLDTAEGRDETERTTAVERRLREAPRLPMDAPGPRPEVGFNFLGAFRLPDEPSLRWDAAVEAAGATRCPSGDPLYRLRLTVRIVGGRLVADLVYSSPTLSHDSAEQIFAAFTRTVADAAGGADVPPPSTSPTSTSGVLLHTGSGASPLVRVESEPARVLLTGATGYLGGYLLAELVRRGAQVTCLVRGERDQSAARRLDIDRGAVRVVAGDITREGLGMSPEGLTVARDANVVVHAAADVRLVASPDELERTNTDGVRRLLAWIDAGIASVRLHHVSTLAVAGHLSGPARRFSEADLRIGQSFLTPYERAKFGAEEIIRSWMASGRQSYVHRTGHLAAHSRTGAFQRNVADNRVYQIVRGYVLAGAAPRRPSATFAFSHVDTVASGIAALALSLCAAPGVYHIETPYEVGHDEFVQWLVDSGHRVTLMDDDAFAAAIARVEREHPTAARVAASWSQLDRRNVVFDRTYTTSVLERLGVRFAKPTQEWWAVALSWAAGVGFLPPPTVLPGTATPP